MTDRRQYRRAFGVVAKVEVAAHRQTTEFNLRTLSAGGASINGPTPLEVGDKLKLSIVLDGKTEHISAEVARVTKREGERERDDVGIAFRGVSDKLADRIEEIVMATLERQHAESPPTVLIIDRDIQRATAVERSLSATATRRVASMLEATQALDDLAVHYVAVVVGADRGDDPIQSLVYLQLAHSGLKRVVLSAGDVHPDVQKRAHALVSAPEAITSALAS